MEIFPKFFWISKVNLPKFVFIVLFLLINENVHCTFILSFLRLSDVYISFFRGGGAGGAGGAS